MMEVTFLGDDDQQDNITDEMVRAPNAGKVFGRQRGFADRNEARVFLAHWLRHARRDHLAEMTKRTLASVIDHYGPDTYDAGPADERPCGDIVTDLVLDHVLRRMGVNPQAFMLAMVFHPYDEIMLDGRLMTPSRIDQLALGTMTLSCSIELGNGADVSTDSRRIEISEHLPDTILSQAVGRKVSEIVSHPLLDGLDLIVEDIHPVGSGTRIVYSGDDGIRLADIAPFEPGDRR